MNPRLFGAALSTSKSAMTISKGAIQKLLAKATDPSVLRVLHGAEGLGATHGNQIMKNLEGFASGASKTPPMAYPLQELMKFRAGSSPLGDPSKGMDIPTVLKRFFGFANSTAREGGALAYKGVKDLGGPEAWARGVSTRADVKSIWDGMDLSRFRKAYPGSSRYAQGNLFPIKSASINPRILGAILAQL